MKARRLLFGIHLAAAAALLQPLPAAAGPSILVDFETGRVLEQDEAFRPWFPASLTKLMTAYVVLRAVAAEEIDLDSPIQMTGRAAQEPPSKMGYPAGTLITVDNAIKILMVRSANDVATAIAENVGWGSHDRFIARMNAEAARLGMTGTHFVNAHGLHSDSQVTTARDLALLAMAIKREFPQHAHYFSMEALQSGNTIMPNHNDLIGRFVGADGMKTGYTCPAAFNLVASATRGGRTLVAVVIGEHTPEERADKAADLLARGFGIDPGDAPAIASLRPEGDVPAEAFNMRPVVCTEAAVQARGERRDEEGRSIYTSPHIAELTRDRVAVEIAIGGTVGPVLLRFANAPVPLPRPDGTALAARPAQPAAEAAPAQPAAAGVVEASFEQVPAPRVPIPIFKPATSGGLPAAASAYQGG